MAGPVYQPYTINATDGGIIAPIVPEAETTPVARLWLYPRFSISGTAIFPIAAAVAKLEPEAAANIALAKFAETASPPGNQLNQILQASKREAVNPPR